jgi:hypothetical protein
VFALGVWTLAALSAALLVAVAGNTLALIPLFAIGVFTGFTLSQAGLVVHWRRTRPPHWPYKAALNGLGAAATAVATAVFLVTKFTEGAWVVVLAIPVFIAMFAWVHRYYARAGRALGLGEIPAAPQTKPIMVVVPVVGVSRLAWYGISNALSISPHVVAVTVVHDETGHDTGQAREMHRHWAKWDPGVPLRVLRTEYASVAGPIVAFVESLRQRHHQRIVVLIPVAMPGKLRYQLLHNHLDLVLTRALRRCPDVIVARVLMPLDTDDPMPLDTGEKKPGH